MNCVLEKKKKKKEKRKFSFKIMKITNTNIFEDIWNFDGIPLC